jgi:hypothetical protein
MVQLEWPQMTSQYGAYAHAHAHSSGHQHTQARTHTHTDKYVVLTSFHGKND